MTNSHPAPSVSEGEFATMLRRAGLDVDVASNAALHEVYGHLERMLARNRLTVAGTPRGRAAEPASVFVPDQAWPRS